MQKKIIVLAIAGALTAPAMALADSANVTLYGYVDGSMDFVNTGAAANPLPTPPQGTSEHRVSSNQSRLGLKGSDDLGNGLSALWQAEGTLNFAAGTFAFDRNTYVGLKSDTLGTVLIGRYDTPYKISTRNQDIFADSIADNRSIMGGPGMNAANLGKVIKGSSPTDPAQTGFNSAVAFDGRDSQVLAYVSPSFSGVTVAAALVNVTAANTQTNNAKVTATSLAGMYNVAPFYAALAYESHNVTPDPTLVIPSVSEHATKFGLGYSANPFTVNFVYEKTKDDFATGDLISSDAFGHSAWTLNGKFMVSDTDAVKLAYTKVGNLGGDSTNNTDTGAKQVSVGYDHALSKRTTVYAIYTKLSNDQYASYGLYGGGAYNNVGGPSIASGASPSAISLGIKEMF